MSHDLTIARLEMNRKRLHEYIMMKLDERDYHGIADAAMDLREIEREVLVLNRIEGYEGNPKASPKL